MSAPKLTPWFPGDVKPVRKGVYQVTRREYGIGEMFPRKTWLRWNGIYWTHTPHLSLELFPGACANVCSKCTWRGLAQKP